MTEVPEATAVLVVPGAAGPGDFERAAAEQLGAAGHAVHVAELHAESSDRAVLTRLDRALAELAESAGVGDRLAALGAGDGGTRAFLLGCHSRRLAGVVSLSAPLVYDALDADHPMQPLEMALNLSCPLLALYGEDDGVPPEQRQSAERVLSQFARDFDIVTSLGTGPSRSSLDAGSPEAHDVWTRILSFLSRTFAEV